MLRIQTIVFGLAVALAIGAAAFVWRIGSGDPGFGSNAQGRLDVGGPFHLIDQDGRARSDREFRGHWMLVYFGYTSCPDVCPTTLEEIVDALRGLGAKGQNIVPVFITLDPARDSPATLRNYLAAFDPRLVGLTGSAEQIDSVARAYRVYFAKRPLAGGNYSVDHANTIYLMAPDGRFAGTLDDDDGARALEKDLAARL
jgi:cytochrome oxidase Cu insertion factor (SCO1/SenC/PrrC family)